MAEYWCSSRNMEYKEVESVLSLTLLLTDCMLVRMFRAEWISGATKLLPPPFRHKYWRKRCYNKLFVGKTSHESSQ